MTQTKMPVREATETGTQQESDSVYSNTAADFMQADMVNLAVVLAVLAVVEVMTWQK